MITHMEKEIFQQKSCLENAYKINLNVLENISSHLKRNKIKSVIFAARGSSDNSGVLFKYLFETICKIPVSFAAPSVITLYNSKIDYSSSLVIGVSQSGQAADVLAIVEEANSQKAMTITITNYPESPLARAGSYHLFLDTGEEKSVAATKTFMTQMYLLGLLVGFIDNNETMIDDFKKLPKKLDLENSVLETIKLDVLTNIDIFSSVNPSTIKDLLTANKKMPRDFKDELDNRGINLQIMSIEKYRKNAIGLFIEQNVSI